MTNDLRNTAQELIELWSRIDLDTITAREWREIGDKMFWLEEALNA